MTVHLIWAQAQGRAIGVAGVLPWDVPEDLQLFRERTLNTTVVMGRTTWESLPDLARPLPRRRNVVLTRDRALVATGADLMHSVAEALDTLHDFWVIGGGELYRAFLPYADHIVRTSINLRVESADTHAPVLGPQWTTQHGPAAPWKRSVSGPLFKVEELTRRLA